MICFIEPALQLEQMLDKLSVLVPSFQSEDVQQPPDCALGPVKAETSSLVHLLHQHGTAAAQQQVHVQSKILTVFHSPCALGIQGTRLKLSGLD